MSLLRPFAAALLALGLSTAFAQTPTYRFSPPYGHERAGADRESAFFHVRTEADRTPARS